MTYTFNHYLATLSAREAAVAAIEADLWPWTERAPFADPVSRFAAYRGITELGASGLASEVCDWRRFPDRWDVHELHRARPHQSILG